MFSVRAVKTRTIMNILQRTQVSLMRGTLQLRRSVTLSQKGMLRRKDLTFRLAESKDFDAVVKLSKGLYNGYDYLPVLFHDWLEMDNLDIMLAHLGEKLVGLRACFIVDDGKTVIRRAGRVEPEFRSCGVNRELIRVLDNHVRRKFPNVSRQRIITFLNFNPGNHWRKVVEYDVLSYVVAEKPFRAEIPSAENELVLESCTRDFFSKIILFSPVIRRLLPNNVIILDWCPYEPLRSNIDFILKEHDLHFFVEKRPVRGESVSFSHGVQARRVKGVEWLATIYTDDPDLFEAHLLRQFAHACALINDKFTISVPLQQESHAACVRRVLGGIMKLQGTDVIYENDTMKMYETDFN